MRSKNDLRLSFSFLVSTFIIAHSTIHHPQANKRETLEIIIGGGSDTSPPYYSPEPDCPPPIPPPEPDCPPPIPPPEPQCPPPPPPSPPPISPPPPPPLPPPPRSPPLNPPINPFSLLPMAIRVIQDFGKTITSDPQGIVKTWRGNKICIDPSTYKGFICATFPNEKQLKVVGVKFNGFNFFGKPLGLTKLIEGLKDLVFFHVNSNNFSDTIPTAITRFPHLYELDLSNNKFSGPVPETILGAMNLNILDLRFNQYSGLIPPKIFTLDLVLLFLNNNNLHGNIPDNLGSTRALYLTLANNYLTGPIPSTIGKASKTLLEILLLGNQLSGCLPYEIGLLKIATVFDASYNMLTGPIPLSFGCLEKMELLNFEHNKLFGQVPEQLCRLNNLNYITLNDNYFTEVGPECRRLISNNKLNVAKNCILDLENQKSPAECKYFFSQKRSPCANAASFTYIPCRIDYSSSKQQKDSGAPVVPRAQSPTYAALINNNNIN